MPEGKREYGTSQGETYWNWFCCIPKLTYAQREILLKCFGSPEALWRATERELAYLEEKGFAFF